MLSYEAKSIKPHDAIYHHAIEKHGLKPSETRYIDDLGPNIETGKRIGFRSFQYDLNDHPSFERWLAHTDDAEGARTAALLRQAGGCAL